MGASAVSTDDSGVSTTTADVYPEADPQRLQSAVRVLLSGVGEDINREGLRDTPKVFRVMCSQQLLVLQQLLTSTKLTAESGQSLGRRLTWVQARPSQVGQLFLQSATSVQPHSTPTLAYAFTACWEALCSMSQ